MNNTLKREKDFSKVFKYGKKIYSDTFILYYLPSKEVKIGYAVSKKHGKAVVRNRVKRLLREAFRLTYNSVKTDGDIKKKNDKKSYFLVVIPKIKNEYYFEEFKRDFEYLLKKISVI